MQQTWLSPAAYKLVSFCVTAIKLIALKLFSHIYVKNTVSYVLSKGKQIILVQYPCFDADKTSNSLPQKRTKLLPSA